MALIAYGALALGTAIASWGLLNAYRTRSGGDSALAPKVAETNTRNLDAIKRLEDYRLFEKLGVGGSADVYRAVSVVNPSGPLVALKLQREKESLDGLANARFQAEIQASLKLKHPNLAEVYDWGKDKQGKHFMVSELLVGESLRERLRRRPALTFSEIARVIHPLGLALAYLHEQKMVHRDVKPDNVFLTQDGQVKLMDLGIIKSLEAAAMTRAGVVVGTPHYLSPEQINGESAPSSDQYGLGVMIFELLTDVRPFSGTPMEIIEQHLYQPAPRLSKFRRGCPEPLDAAVHRMLAKDPEHRYPAIIEAVRAVCDGLAQGDDDEGIDTVVVVLS